jgi:uncharacterized protein YdiU (UPF0061 family)
MSAIAFDNSYARMPERFYARLDPTPVAQPRIIAVNDGLADDLGLEAAQLRSETGVAWLSGSDVPDGAEPLAAAYAGHQFGHFVPQLGDGRAILLGEVIGRDGVRRDIQLKGSGRTPYSRGGDGRAAIGPVIREYLLSEAMAALGVPTTRALAAVTTGESLLREDGRLPGAVLTRIAQSHIRVGTFQFFLARRDVDALRALADHVLDRHYPEARAAENPYRALLEGVIARQAALVAQWMQLGFIHGVMNTDNCSIAGETIDYGPCAFMDRFDPGKVFSSIDRQGRYAWGNQGRIALWNLSRFAEALLFFLGPDEDAAVAEAQAALEPFSRRFEAAHISGFAAKIGMADVGEGDAALVEATLHAMTEGGVDHTLFFRRLTVAARTGETASVRTLFETPEVFDAWLPDWQARIAEEDEAAAVMEAVNPIFIPRNHRVEQVIQAARGGDYGPFERLHAVLSRPYAEQPERAEYEAPPTAEEEVHRTFCGT